MDSRKVWIGICLVVAAVAGIVVLSRSNFRISKTETINAPVFTVNDQVTNLHQWQKWYPAIKKSSNLSVDFDSSSGSIRLRVKGDYRIFTPVRTIPGEISFTETSGSHRRLHTIIMVSDNLGIRTHVRWSATMGVFDWITSYLNPKEGIAKNLSGLKQYIEDPALFYGIPLKMDSITNTLLISKRDTVPLNLRFTKLKELFAELHLYANVHSLETDSTQILGIFPVPGNLKQVAVIANLPVKQKAPESMGISYLEMPPGGKVLTALYNGPYGKVKNVHEAMQRYIRDKSLKKIALSYEVFNGSPIPENDSATVKVLVCYPIF